MATAGGGGRERDEPLHPTLVAELDDDEDPATCTILSLSDMDLRAGGAMPSADEWAKLPALKVLFLEEVKLPAAGLRAVLAGCPQLNELYLTYVKFGAVEGGIGAVAGQLADAPVGRELPLTLSLGSVEAWGRAGDALARLFAGCPRLRVLYIPECGLKALPSALGTHCRVLEELDARRNELAGVGAVPASLCTLPKLRVLNLRGNRKLTALPPEIVGLTQLDGALDEGVDGEGHWLSLDGCDALVAPPYRIVEVHLGTVRFSGLFADVCAWFRAAVRAPPQP